MKRNLKIKRTIFVMISVLCITFIFAQSALPAEKSSQESGVVLDILNRITEFLGLGAVFNGHIVRKLAHFTEFAVLSGVLFCTYKLFFEKLPKIIIATFATYLTVAVIDELLQLFSDGRACQFKDVLIDFSGGTFVLIILTLFCVIKNRKYNRT